MARVKRGLTMTMVTGGLTMGRVSYKWVDNDMSLQWGQECKSAVGTRCESAVGTMMRVFEIWKIFQKSSKFGRFLKNLRNFEDIWKILLNLGEMLRCSDCCCEN